MRSTSVLIIIFSLLVAQDHSGYAGNFLSNGSSARAIAVGNAFTAGSDLYFPAYYNPAGIAGTTDKKVLFAHQFLSLDRRQSTVGITLPLPPIGGLSLGWIGSGVNDIQGRDLTGNKTEILSSSEDILMASFGIIPISNLQIGGTINIMQNRLPNMNGNITGTGIGFDFGVLYKVWENLIIGAVIKNLNAAYQWSNEIDENLNRTYEDKFPIQVRGGIEYQKYDFVLVNDAGIYLMDGEILETDFRFGLEYTLLEDYFVRGGYFENHYTLGFGLDLKKYNNFNSNIDYAIIFERNSGLSHAISYAINF